MSATRLSFPLTAGGRAVAVFTTRAEGDLALGVPADVLAARRAAIVGRPWLALRQVHGDQVVVADADSVPSPGVEGDGLVTDRGDVALAVLTADCGPVLLVSPEGVVGVVHAGWRGLRAGVVERGVAAVRRQGGEVVEAIIGPCIRSECYEFGPDELDDLVGQFGAEVASTTAAGRPALDLPAALAVALRRSGVIDVIDLGACTSCSAEHFSYRARREDGRQATVVWIERDG